MKTTLTVEEYTTRIKSEGPELMVFEHDSSASYELTITVKGQKLRVLLVDFLQAASLLRAV